MKKHIINKKLVNSITTIAIVLFLGISALSGIASANDLQLSKPVEQRPPPKPITTGITEGCINVDYEYCTTANFGCPHVYYRFDWDADGSGDITDWYGPYYTPLEECCKTCSWDIEGPYTVRSQVKASCGNTGDWSDPLYVEIYESGPILSYDSSSYNFGIILEGQILDTTFEIWNAGVDELSWSLSDDYDWLTYYPDHGTSTGEHDTITVYIDTTSLEGLYTADINIISDGMNGNGIFTVSFYVSSGEVILSEGFEDSWVADSNGDLAPPGWENHILNTGNSGYPQYLPYHWGRVDTVSLSGEDIIPYEGNYQSMVQWDYNNQDEWLITPEIDISDYENTELTFMFFGHLGSTHNDHYYVKVSPTGGYDKADFTDILWDATSQPEGDNHYDTPIVIDLSAYDRTGPIRIAWHDYRIGGLWHTHFIDDIKITATPLYSLQYSPSSHDFGTVWEGQVYDTTFDIWNSGTGELEWSLSDSYEWLTYVPENGESTVEHDIIVVYIDTNSLSGGHYSGNIDISSNGGSGTFAVTFDVHTPTEWHVYPGDSIQNTIDGASCGDIIYVHNDGGDPYTYIENVKVNKWIGLIGDGMDTVTIQALDSEDHTVHITVSRVTITGFTITNSYVCGWGGICLEYADDCTISNNNCRRNLCAGIFMKHSNNSKIIKNNVSDNDCGGIKLSDSHNNIVKSNTMMNNLNMGINVYSGSSDNLIYDNYFDNPNKNAIDSVPWANTWNVPKTHGTNILGGSYLGGNYWSDYTGEDNDGDGFGDTPYEIKNAPGTEVMNIDYLPLKHFYLDLVSFPWYEANNPSQKYSGPAVAKMWLSYLWWNNIVDPEPPEYPQTQQELYNYGHPENYECNQGSEQLDARGLWYTVQYLDPAWNPYHYNFGIKKRDNVETALNDICHWIAYPAGRVDGYPVHVPAAVPTGGNYDNWMAVRGIHTSTNPWETDNYDIFGFWINDPKPSGLGANSYKTTQEWTDNYYFNLTDVSTEDPCYDKWVSIVEPPEYDAEVNIVSAKAMFKKVVKPVPTEKTITIDNIKISIFEEVIKEKQALDVVKAAIDSVSQELIPYDPEFAELFAKTIVGEPLHVNDNSDGYYIVPFNEPVQKSDLLFLKSKPIVFEKTGEKCIELVSRAVDRKAEIDLILIKPISEMMSIEPISKGRTLIVVIVDDEDGHFKEASWVDEPVKYLSISKEDALNLVADIINPHLFEKLTIELVHRDASPYYPDWKITINGNIFYVSQDGTVFLG